MEISIYGLDDARHLYRNKKFLSGKIKSAIEFANKKHAGQVRKSLGKEPMIYHCLNVGDTLAKAQSSENTIMAGILHDVIEDTSVSKQDLEKKFGKAVSNLVSDVTENGKTKDWMQRCREYIAHLKKSSKEAMSISAADKIDNMRSMTDSVSKKFNIFKNMVGTPEMQLEKFKGVYKAVKGKIPLKIEKIYIRTLKNFVRTMKKFKYLK